MTKRKIKRDPLSFWALLFPDKSSNATWKSRNLLIWSHIYGFIGFCLLSYIVGWCVYLFYIMLKS